MGGFCWMEVGMDSAVWQRRREDSEIYEKSGRANSAWPARIVYSCQVRWSMKKMHPGRERNGIKHSIRCWTIPIALISRGMKTSRFSVVVNAFCRRKCLQKYRCNLQYRYIYPTAHRQSSAPAVRHIDAPVAPCAMTNSPPIRKPYSKQTT